MNDHEMQDKKMAEVADKVKAGIPGLPADKVQALLYRSNGYYYHVASCCNYADLHSATIISNRMLPTEECGTFRAANACNIEKAEIAADQFRQHVHYAKDHLNKFPNKYWFVATDGTMEPDPEADEFEINQDENIRLLKDYGAVSFNYNPLKKLMFQLRILVHRVTLATEPPKHFEYLFGVADKCRKEEGVTTEISLLMVERGAPPDTVDYRLHCATVEYNDEFVPILIIENKK